MGPVDTVATAIPRTPPLISTCQYVISHEKEIVSPPVLTPIPHVVNDMFVYATHDVLGFGSGGGGFALRLDETLEHIPMSTT